MSSRRSSRFFAFFQTIRVRLTFWYTLLVFSTLVLFGGFTYYYTNKSLMEGLDWSLRYEVRWVRDYIEPQASKLRPERRVRRDLPDDVHKPDPFAPAERSDREDTQPFDPRRPHVHIGHAWPPTCSTSSGMDATRASAPAASSSARVP